MDWYMVSEHVSQVYSCTEVHVSNFHDCFDRDVITTCNCKLKHNQMI